MRISEMQAGQKGCIVKVKGHGSARKRAVDAGFYKGVCIEILDSDTTHMNIDVEGMQRKLTLPEASMIEVLTTEEAAHELQVKELSTGELKDLAHRHRHKIEIALVGQPLSGKNSLFTTLTQGHAAPLPKANDILMGERDFQDYHLHITNLPDTYSLTSRTADTWTVRRHLVGDNPDIVISVIDATDLERSMQITAQLLDMNLRVIVALNKFDAMQAQGSKLDYQTLSRLLGTPIVPTVSLNNEGLEHLLHLAINIYEGADFLDDDGEVNKEVMRELQEWHRNIVHSDDDTEHLADFTRDHTLDTRYKKHAYRHIHIYHGGELEQSIETLRNEVWKSEHTRYRFSTRYVAIALLEGDADIEQFVRDNLPNSKAVFALRDKERRRYSRLMGESVPKAIRTAKRSFIQGALKETYIPAQSSAKANANLTERLDRLVTHKVWGVLIFLTSLFIMFEATFVLGEYPMQGIEWLVEKIGTGLEQLMPNGPIKDMVIDGIIGGVGGVIVFLPNILILYFFISLMEDSGYMSRAAFIMDKAMHKMGLHGKSFITLIMGFGCNVPAVLATRMIESRKSRLITMLVTPLMSCSARLPVYIIFVAAFFPHHSGIVLMGLYLTGIILAVLVARLLSRTVMRGDETPYVMELTPYRRPAWKVIFKHTWDKGYEYLKKMGGVILVASIVVWFLGYYPRSEQYSTPAEQQEHSYIGRIGKAIEPAIEPLGFDWKMGIGLVSGVGAKELIVSTLGVLYANQEVDSAESEAQIAAALKTVTTPAAALAYMLFVLIYFPCLATLIAIKKETKGWGWAIFTAVYTTALAWIVAFTVFQIGKML
ncbi:MAG: ferrous iron transport protein B [Bacteroidaceae bacterium]|nr:ferrous iron transport protein B [Bacteroidaceae bacterium]MBR4041257.1 ferrous iron transport protein B [Bacteroidaceae bacterium]